MRRSQVELIYAVLEVLRYQGSAKITHIMYKVNLNCLILRDLLNILQFHGYVTVESRDIHPLSQNRPCKAERVKSSEYSLTVKGLEFCKSVQSTMKALSSMVETYERERYITEAEAMKNFQTRGLTEE